MTPSKPDNCISQPFYLHDGALCWAAEEFASQRDNLCTWRYYGQAYAGMPKAFAERMGASPLSQSKVQSQSGPRVCRVGWAQPAGAVPEKVFHIDRDQLRSDGSATGGGMPGLTVTSGTKIGAFLAGKMLLFSR